MNGSVGDLWVDVGGTFTDAIYRHGDGTINRVKVLSADLHGDTLDGTPEPNSSPAIVSPVMAAHRITNTPLGQTLPAMRVRLGTTRGTNALLTRTGADVVLATNTGHTDVLQLGDQTRDQLFAFDVSRPPPLTDHVVAIDGRLNHHGEVTTDLDHHQITRRLKHHWDRGRRSIAIGLLHSTRSNLHERRVRDIAKDVGFRSISCSHEVAPVIGFTARVQTTVLDAYLNPVIEAYLANVRQQFGGSLVSMLVMTSGGVLVDSKQFRGRDSVLSGPAGGVIALRNIAHGQTRGVIGLDMGGTSTDVSYVAAEHEDDTLPGGETMVVGRRFQTRISGIDILTPMMDIETVASGGGSICGIKHGRMMVGPASAGAVPGPACYGRGGPLTITDINVVLGRLPIDRFAFPLDATAAKTALRTIASTLGQSSEMVAEGFLDIAVAQMAEAVRTVTTARGLDGRTMALAGFGGAAGAHVCRVAQTLGIRRVIDHPHASLLSAVGMGLAPRGRIITASINEPIEQWTTQRKREEFARLIDKCQNATDDLDGDGSNIQIYQQIELRYRNTDSTLTLDASIEDLNEAFHRRHRQQFGFDVRDAAVEVVAIRVRSESKTGHIDGTPPPSTGDNPPTATPMFLSDRWVDVDRWQRQHIATGQIVEGPALIASKFTTLVVEPCWHATMQPDGSLIVEQTGQTDDADSGATDRSVTASNTNLMDAAGVEIVARRLGGIADSMGETLRRTAISVNVRQRRDYSCGVFDGGGRLVAGALHVPVHLGSMSHTVMALRQRFAGPRPGDIWLTNDPFQGGSHLPDVTVVMPIFANVGDAQASFYVAARAHHSEIGGITPGSMPPSATSLAEEGVRIAPMHLIENGVPHFDLVRQILVQAPHPSRRPDQNIADLRAQVAACVNGEGMLRHLVQSSGIDRLTAAIKRLHEVAGNAVATFIQTLPDGQTMTAKDQLDDGHRIAVNVTRRGKRLKIQLRTDGQHPGPFNAPSSITTAAVLYVLQCMCEGDLPLCDGVLRDIDLDISPGILNPKVVPNQPAVQCPAIVAGNVETSNRVVDVLIETLSRHRDDDDRASVPAVAGSGGTMNNVIFGDETFGHYETIGNGAGATKRHAGGHAIQTHMTNTAATDVEIAERQLPVIMSQVRVRSNSGGAGRHRGGDGIVRQYQFTSPVTVSLLTSRRTTHPRGVAGGLNGKPGQNIRLLRDGSEMPLPSTTTYLAEAGEGLRIETPGGGGHGLQQEFVSERPDRSA